MPTDKPSAERARAEEAREFRKKWFNEHDTGSMTARMVETALMAEFAALAVLREREECAKAMCEDCANKGNWRDAEFANGVWFHRLKTSPYSVVDCKAAAIWARDAERG